MRHTDVNACRNDPQISHAFRLPFIIKLIEGTYYYCCLAKEDAKPDSVLQQRRGDSATKERGDNGHVLMSGAPYH